MRLLIAGLVLFAVGVGFKEYSRRHPDSVVADVKAADQPKAPEAAAGPEALLETKEAGDLDTQPLATVDTATAAKGAGGFDTLLSGTFGCGNLRHGDTFAILVVRRDNQASLVRVEPGQPAKVLATRKERIDAVAVDGNDVLWAEGGRIFSMAADGSSNMVVRVSFAHAHVTSLAAKGGTIVAALVPPDADPLSDAPEGAIARINSSGKVSLVAGLQVRAHDVATDGKEAVWVAGYPSGLSRAALDGSSSGRIAERADGPVVVQEDGVIHRYPQTGSPEVRKVARTGGSMQTLVVGDTDWLDADATHLWYTTAGFGARLYRVTGTGEPEDLGELGGASAGVAALSKAVVVLVQSDATCTVRALAEP
jgi:hypothetical protein